MSKDSLPQEYVLQSKSAVLHAARDIRIEQREVAEVGPDDVLVKVMATGLCGSDLHYYQHGCNGDFTLKHSMCLGHEASGVIVRLGSKSNDTFSLGDNVIIEPGQACTLCDYCLNGRYNLCPEMRFASSAKTVPHLDGTLQQYLVWPARLCHRLPSGLSYEVGALAEPLAVVLQALNRTRLTKGQSVLVIGAGAVGILACAAAKAYGASYVAAIDIDSHRLQMCKENGWTDEIHCVTSHKQQPSFGSRNIEDAATIKANRRQAENVLDTLASKTSLEKLRNGFDIVYECTGVPSCINLSIFSCKSGGKIGLIGMGNPIVTLALGSAALREVDIIGVFRYANMFPKAVELLSMPSFRHNTKGGRIESIFSHHFPLIKTAQEFDTLAKGESENGRRVIKVLITADSHYDEP